MIDAYKSIIKDLKIDEKLKEKTLVLLDTYDGENYDALNEFLEKFIYLLSQQEPLKLKAEAYEKMRDVELEFQENLEEFREEYKSFVDTKGNNIPVMLNDTSEGAGSDAISQLT